MRINFLKHVILNFKDSVVWLAPVVYHNLHTILCYLHVDLFDQSLRQIVETHSGDDLLIVLNDIVKACVLEILCLRPNLMCSPEDD